MDRGKRVPMNMRIVADALKKREIRQFNLKFFLGKSYSFLQKVFRVVALNAPLC